MFINSGQCAVGLGQVPDCSWWLLMVSEYLVSGPGFPVGLVSSAAGIHAIAFALAQTRGVYWAVD